MRATHSPWIAALAEVRHRASQEGWCYLNVQRLRIIESLLSRKAKRWYTQVDTTSAEHRGKRLFYRVF